MTHNDFIREIWTGGTSNATSSSIPSYTDYSAYSNYYSTNDLYKIGKDIRVTILEPDILKSMDIQYKKMQDIKSDPIPGPINSESVKFNPENLWSESKCLKKNTVQSVKEKSQLDITPRTKTIELIKEK